MKNKISLTGLVIGFANGIFGSGGGIIAVPMLRKKGLEEKKSHASSLAIMLPLSVVSAAAYAMEKTIDWKMSLTLIPFGLVGAAIGTVLLKKISPRILSAIFGVLLVFAGVRGLLGSR